MLTTMVSGYYDANGSDVYPPGPETYGEYCYGMQDMCSQMACAYHGPPGGVRMVNGSSGPMAMPLQVPPGHLVQQVVDENGAVRHIVFSPPMPLPVGPHYSPSHASTAMATASPYYAYPQPPYSAPPHFHPQPPMQPVMSPQGMHSMMQEPPSPQSNGQDTQTETSPSPPSSLTIPTQKDDRHQRQTYKFRRKLESRSKEAGKLVILSGQNSPGSKKERRKFKEKSEDGIRLNGSSGSNASEDEEVAWMLSEYLSNMRPPTVAEVSSRSALVCWKPPDLPSSDLEKKLSLTTQQSEITYEVMICEKVKDGHFKSVYNGPDHHCTITSLKPSTEYYVCVQASMDDVRGSTVKGLVFRTLNVEIEAPQPPRLCSRTKNSLTLKWNSIGDSSSKIKNYVLEYDQGYGENNFVPIYSGPLKQFRVTKLLPSTCFRFRLGVTTEKGKSPYSPICAFCTSGSPPSQPMPPVLKQAFLNRLHLEWDRRPSDNDFSLQIEDENMRHGFLTAYNGRDTSFVCSGLRGNTEYKFRLCANNEEGSSPWSKVVTYFTLPDKLSCPGKPIPKGRIHASCFRVSWESPKDKQSSVTKYILEVDRGFGYESVYTGPDSEFFLENLLPGTTYKLRVACISSTGHSPYSETSIITTAAVCPGRCAPPKLQSKPESSFLCLEWAHPEHDGGAAIAEYEVDMTSPDNTTLQAYKGSETSCIVNGLSPGRPYLFQVRAFNRVGAGPWSDPLEVVSGAGPPDAPRNFALQCPSPHSCLLSWEEPVNNGAAITSYQLQMHSDDSSDDEENFRELYDGLSCVYEVKGLSAATQYHFRVRAVNDAGPGANSETLTCETPASVPGAISKINVSPASNALYLSWNEPQKNGSDVSSYNVELDGYVYNTEGSIPELCVVDLTPESLYRIRVQAINAIGEGPFSEMFEVSTLKSPPDPPQLECVSAAHNCLRLRWGDGKNEESINYTLEISSRAKSFVPIYHGTGFSHKVNRLQENTAYHFRICASSESGPGPFSQTYVFRTSLAPPPVLKAPKVSNVTENSCLVEWAGAKATTGNSYSYQLQLTTEWGLEPKAVYQGPETKCTLTSLEPLTQYTVRVAAIRHHQDEDLLGSPGPTTAFTTQSAESSCCSSTASSVVVPQATSYTDRKTQADRQWAALIVVAFNLLAFLLAAVFEHTFQLNKHT